MQWTACGRRCPTSTTSAEPSHCSGLLRIESGLSIDKTRLGGGPMRRFLVVSMGSVALLLGVVRAHAAPAQSIPVERFLPMARSVLEQDNGCRNCVLRGADLREAHLIGADLRGADLQGADLRDANLEGADLTGARLMQADLRGANLTNADLSDVDLRQADLRSALVINAYAPGVNTAGMRYAGADLLGSNLIIGGGD